MGDARKQRRQKASVPPARIVRVIPAKSQPLRKQNMAFFGSIMREFLQDPFFTTATSFMNSAMGNEYSFYNTPQVPARVPRGPARAQQQQNSPFSAPHAATRESVGRARRPGHNYFLPLEDAPRPRVALRQRDIKPTPPKRLTTRNRESDSASTSGSMGAGAGPAARSEGHCREPRARRHDPELMPAVTVRDVRIHCVSSRNLPAGSGAQERPSRPTKTVTIVQKVEHVTQKSAASKPELAAQEETPKVFRALGWDPCMTKQLEHEIVLRNLNVRWDQIAGLQDAKMILHEAIVLPSLMPEFFKGIRRPWKGILMVGPPGTGKTMLAKAVTTECGSTFFNVSSSVLTSKYRGDSEKIVRLLFDMAKFYAPSIVFIDEVDSLCSVRSVDSEHEASRRFKSELLIQMDGLDSEQEADAKYIMVLAATNHPWDIDDAFRRRFEKRIYVPLPDEITRCSLLNSCLKNVTVEKDIDVANIARRLNGYSGADIINVCRNAAMMSIRRKNYGRNAEEMKKIKKEDIDLPITVQDFEEAVAKCKASVSTKVIEKYEHWMSEYESC